MSAPDYAVLTIDLAILRTNARIVDVGRPVDAVAVLELPVGVAASLAFGDNRPFIPLATKGQSFELCPVASEGIFLSNPASAGSLSLLVSFGGLVAVAA